MTGSLWHRERNALQATSFKGDLLSKTCRSAIVSTTLLLMCTCSALAGEGAHEAGGMTHRMMVLALQLGVIVFLTKTLSGLAHKLHLPGVLGELAGGIMFGPYLLGTVPLPALPHGLFPLIGEFPVSPELYGFCSVAAIILLFHAGLETNVTMFIRYSVAGTLVGLGGVLLSFVFGDLAAVWFSSLLFDEALSFFSPAALFLGVISTATSVGITARVLSERNKIDSPEGVTILSGAVVDDVIGIILLAVTMGMISATTDTGAINWAHIGGISAKAVGIWLIGTTLGLAASHKISILLKLFRDRQTIAIMSLGLALILASLFEEAGLAMIIGAYVMGLSLSRTDISQMIKEKQEPIAAFLVPVFFFVMGMLVDIKILASPQILAFGGLYTVIAILAKVFGCALPALATGFNIRGAMRIGVGMLPRGEVALIVAGIGLAAGAISKEVFGVGVMMTLITTIIAPPLLLWLFNSDNSGLRRPPEREEKKSMRFSFPSEAAVEILMRKIRVVFESDGFFVNALHREGNVYQMRKDESTVTLRKEGLDLIFDGNDQEHAFVQAAVLEVVSDLRRMAEDLAKPIKQESLADTGVDHNGGSEPASLVKHVSPVVLTAQLRATDKQAIIKELVKLAAKGGRIRDVTKTYNLVLERERTGSTALQHGIAVPHGKTDDVDDMVCAIGLKPEGIDFDSLDGKPSRIFVLVLAPPQFTGQYIRLLATISQELDEHGRETLLRCSTPAEMYAALQHLSG
ncbi:MAG: Kef-type K+ transport system membrane component KefB/mannitol [Kiritimatiellia bacterium]|jgi:Kef-type K+ transport system membrane component KefB/mannitol/fructose-specific phosphotransferase system IIA component (Ntr-type)